MFGLIGVSICIIKNTVYFLFLKNIRNDSKFQWILAKKRNISQHLINLINL